MSIKLRTVKGSTLTFGEVDENFSSLFYSASLEGRDLSLYYTASQLSPTTNPVTFTIPGFPYTGSAQITGSLGITGSLQVTGNANFLAGLTGSLLGNASTATTASHVNLVAGEYIRIAKVNDMFVISGSTFPYTGSAIITGSLEVSDGITGSLQGNATTATTLQTARTINGVPFDGGSSIVIADSTKLPLAGGTMTGNISFVAGQTWPTFNQNTTGNAGTATVLQTARTINGVSFNGSADINITDSSKLPVAGGTMTGPISFAGNQTWPTFNQNTTGNAATAAILQVPRNINGVAFDGSADINITDSSKLPLAGGTMTGNISFVAGQPWPTFNQDTTGNAATATKLATTRTINGVAFDGTADITLPESTRLPIAVGTVSVGNIPSGGASFSVPFGFTVPPGLGYVVMLTVISLTPNNAGPDLSAMIAVKDKNPSGFSIVVGETGSITQNIEIDYVVFRK